MNSFIETNILIIKLEFNYTNIIKTFNTWELFKFVKKSIFNKIKLEKKTKM
jgi:hypothetical protein